MVRRELGDSADQSGQTVRASTVLVPVLIVATAGVLSLEVQVSFA